MIKLLLCCLLLLMIVSKGEASNAPAIPTQIEPLIIEAPIFQWGRDCSIAQVLNTNDFDIDPKSGERDYAIISIKYNCPLTRDATFDFTLSDGIKRVTVVSKDVKGAINTLILGRETTAEFAWNFTPAHVDVKPGSVSNPSLLTAGGTDTSQSSTTTALFTPTANGLLLVGWGGRPQSADVTYTFTNTHTGSGAWDSSVTKMQDSNPQFMRTTLAFSQTGPSPGEGSITNTYSPTTIARKSWIVAESIGHNTSTPLSESNTGGAGSGTTLTISLSGVAVGNLGIGVVAVRNNAAVTDGTGEDEVTEANSGGSNNARTQMQYGPDDSQDWSWITTEINAGVVAEFAAAAGGAAAQVIMID